MKINKISIIFLISLLTANSACPQVRDPLNPFDNPTQIVESAADPDQNKSSDELLREALLLQSDERHLDARTKLLKVLEKNPKEYKAHLALASYYIAQVGHFKLALKYTKQSIKLLKDENGEPPYSDNFIRAMHSDMLSLLSQCRLNLDDYEGALKPLEYFETLGYTSQWHASSKAWVLMKLNRIEEAIKIARLGLLFGSNLGSTNNVLAILLSMSGNRQGAINIFKQTIKFELKLGELGQASTPLNNIGEVYREIFEEERARDSWERAVRLPDGCEHILPSFNLAVLALDEANYGEAAKVITSFESCIAQFPLKNGEEHKSLVHLMRGRIALHQGYPDLAIKNLNSSLSRQQWFGKIGTSKDDLQVGIYSSLAQAYLVKNNHIKKTIPKNISERLKNIKTRTYNYFKSKWYKKQALRILIDDLNSMEDLFVRHTDSMIEYATFGSVLSELPTVSLKRRINNELKEDKRKEAKFYYDSYIAENQANKILKGNSLKILRQVINKTRPIYDRALKQHSLALLLKQLNKNSTEYKSSAIRLFQLSRAILRNNNLHLPVSLDKSATKIKSKLKKVGFFEVKKEDSPFRIEYLQKEGEHILKVSSTSPVLGKIEVSSKELRDAINNLSDSLFTES